MNNRKYIQKIQIGKNITDIFNLPCVRRIEKQPNGKPLFLVATGPDLNELHVNVGDWICQGNDGFWYLDRYQR